MKLETYLKILLILLGISTLMVCFITFIEIITPRYPDNMVVQCVPAIDDEDEYIEAEGK